MMNKNYVLKLNKLLYICCARPYGRTVRHITTGEALAQGQSSL